MSVREFGGNPSPLSPDDEAFFDKERLVNLLKSTLVFTYGRGNGISPDRSSLEYCDNGPENLVVNGIEPPLVYSEFIKGIPCYGKVYCSVSHNLGKIPDPLQKSIGNSWGSP